MIAFTVVSAALAVFVAQSWLNNLGCDAYGDRRPAAADQYTRDRFGRQAVAI
jgi:hypothetical protein